MINPFLVPMIVDQLGYGYLPDYNEAKKDKKNM